jgi:phosphoribosyl-ATP pyrophosphohydrolase/phosphoribosyl-AMP cyclohydrolase
VVTVPENLRFDANGMIPAIAQDAENGQVLMHAYMNEEAVARTIETGLAHYYSRSRGRLWQKGEESGHVQRVRSIRYDCDEDTLLLAVEQVVAACHTGHRSCFYRELPGSGRPTGEVSEQRFDPAAVYRGWGILAELYAFIRDRKARPLSEGSDVVSLLSKEPDQALKKIAEVAAGVLLAAKEENREQLTTEMAGLWFHSLIVLAQSEIRPEEIAQEMGRRFGKQKPQFA